MYSEAKVDTRDEVPPPPRSSLQVPHAQGHPAQTVETEPQLAAESAADEELGASPSSALPRLDSLVWSGIESDLESQWPITMDHFQ